MSVLVQIIRGLFAADNPHPAPLDSPGAWQPLGNTPRDDTVTTGGMFSSPTGGRRAAGGWVTPLANLPDPPADEIRGWRG